MAVAAPSPTIPFLLPASYPHHTSSFPNDLLSISLFPSFLVPDLVMVGRWWVSSVAAADGPIFA
ncbi:hypothetical protein Syun_005256 [Stephania yunnanensis]|uniref:Uncharacterized protein n=1 Tax=Stephania yunnanensis TaxID=152371 RepID=A0AAP0L8K1_9MAGN